ncbi:MAG: hypothetical protein HKO91_05930 [Desulfobacterales bacterium]|nr:hypothetical protein [Desulfobacterales bacterium]
MRSTRLYQAGAALADYIMMKGANARCLGMLVVKFDFISILHIKDEVTGRA